MTELNLAQRMSLLGSESAFEVLARANALEAQGHDVIHLEIGQPDFKTPGHIMEAAHRAMLAGNTGYTNAQGVPALRQAIADYCLQYKNVKTDIDEIVVTSGAKPISCHAVRYFSSDGAGVRSPSCSARI